MKRLPTALALLAAGGLFVAMLVWLGREIDALHASRSARPAEAPAAVERGPTTGDHVDYSALIDEAMEELLRDLLEAPNARPGELVLTFKSAEAYRAFLARAGGNVSILGQLDGLNAVRVRVISMDGLKRELLASAGDLGEISANYLVQAPTVPTTENREAGTYYAVGNNLLRLLGVAGGNSTWGSGVTIAILDSGVAPDATFGGGRLRSLDVGYGSSPESAASHGTSVASLAAGASADAPGVAPGASLLSVRVTGADGLSDIFTLAKAIIAATDAGAQVINVSMGGYDTNNALTQAIAYAEKRGAVVVASAGNDQTTQLTWPAADARVVSVGAVDALEQQVIFSNSGDQLSVTAPGYGVQAAGADGERIYFTGTSASAPVVAGAIAAMMSQNPGMTAAEAWTTLQSHTNDAGTPGSDPDYGSGVLNLGWAMARNDAGYVDTAISSYSYDAATRSLAIVVQNRSTQTVNGLGLTVTSNGASNQFTLGWLEPGATEVVNVPLSAVPLDSTGRIIVRSELFNAAGVTDEVPSNNRKASAITPPAP